MFGKIVALNGVSLNVNPGKVVVIIGPSGSGKSTLLRCMNHMEVESQGEVWVDGERMTGDQKRLNRIRSEIGMVFQSFNLYPHLSVLENVVLAQKIVRKIDKKTAREVINTWRNPPRNIDFLMAMRSFRENSRPMVNSRRTIPISAKISTM